MLTYSCSRLSGHIAFKAIVPLFLPHGGEHRSHKDSPKHGVLPNPVWQWRSSTPTLCSPPRFTPFFQRAIDGHERITPEVESDGRGEADGDGIGRGPRDADGECNGGNALQEREDEVQDGECGA